MLNGKMRIVDWKEGEEPWLQVEKRGRFITNMGFANFVTAAVDTDDPRIKSSAIVILEEGDEGTFDRGTPTRKMVHQLSSTHDPIFSLKVPASRIVGGYTVKNGAIVPNYSHSEVIEAVFKRTRVTVAVMTSAKLLSAIEPVIRYQRGRFRGAQQADARDHSLRPWPATAPGRVASPHRRTGPWVKLLPLSVLQPHAYSTFSIRWRRTSRKSSQKKVLPAVKQNLSSSAR